LSTSRSFGLYVSGWNVIEKVRRAKSYGTFDAITTNADARRASLARQFDFRPKA
jgi:hypothetical protein